jgi:hypothetical protein
MMRFSLQYESQRKGVNFGDPKGRKQTQIQIFRKDPKAPPFLIVKNPDRLDAAVLLLSGNELMVSNALENEKDNLGRVTASYESGTPVHFTTFQEFLKWLGIE